MITTRPGWRLIRSHRLLFGSSGPFVFFLLLHFLVFCQVAAGATPLADYRFEGCDWSADALVTDETGRYPGKVVEGAKAVPGIHYNNGGVCNVANLRNDGTDYNRHIRLTDNPIPLPNNWTLMMWVNFPLVFTNHALYGNYRYSVLAGGTNDLCWLRIREGGTDITWGASSVPDSHVREFPDTLTGWHHLAFVGSGNATSLYLDGALLNSTDYKQTGSFNRIGSTSDPVTTTGRQNIDTQIDEVKFYNSTLNLAEIKGVYDNEVLHKNWDGTARSCAYCGIVDHYEIIHDGSALTCVPEDIRIVACSNAACSTLMSTASIITLTPSGWTGGDIVTFTGSANLKLRHTTPETVALGISVQTPVATNGYKCVSALGGATVSCNMRYYDSGFDFDIPTQTSCKESTNITISAVGRDPGTGKCIPLFAGLSRDISFWSTYITPATGTLPVRVNGTAITGSSPGTPVSLAFNANGQATFKVAYSDAGLVQLNARYLGSGNEAGLSMLGNDSFVTGPAGLCVYSDAPQSDCPSGNGSCSAFVAAKTPFPLKVKGVCWQVTGETNSQFCDNATTPNFMMDNIGLTHTLVAPLSGVPGSIDISTANITSGGEVSVQQAVSEVGVFKFTADPPSDYLGAGDIFTGATFTSNNIGRFIPDHFIVTILPDPPVFAESCTVYTYLGQPFDWQTVPEITITAMNGAATPAITRNYEADFWKLDANLVYSYMDNNVPALASPLTPQSVTRALPNTSNCGGTVTLALAENDGITGNGIFEGFNYTRPLLTTPVAPFVPNVTMTIRAVELTDSDAVCYRNAAGCLDFQVNGITGTHMRHGRALAQSVFGPETGPLVMPVSSFYYDGTTWQKNTDDDCTVFTYGLTPSGISVTCSPPSPVTMTDGAADLTLTPVANSGRGTVSVGFDFPAWLHPDSAAVATFGISRGNDRIINWQELMR